MTRIKRTGTKRTSRRALLAATLSAALLSLPQISMAAGSGRGGFGAEENGSASDVQAKLKKAQFKNVKVDMDNGVATLTGSVDLYEYKMDADKRGHKAKGVNAVRNDFQVAGPRV